MKILKINLKKVAMTKPKKKGSDKIDSDKDKKEGLGLSKEKEQEIATDEMVSHYSESN